MAKKTNSKSKAGKVKAKTKTKKVKGTKKHAIYRWLTDQKQNGWNKKGPSWNFTKYLIDENGKLIKRFSPRTLPLSDEITSLIN